MIMYRLGIDLDGVLVDFGTGIRAHLLKEFNIPKDYTPQQWAIEQDIEKRFGIPSKEIKRAYGKLMGTQDFWYELPGYDDHIKSLAEFLDLGAEEIFYVTSRPKGSLAPTNAWLSERGLLGDNASVIQVAHKLQKTAIFTAIEADFSIDDHIVVVQDAHMCIPNHKAFLMVRDYNTEESKLPAFDKLNKVKSMGEFLAYVR